jgi:hypothetical protein
MYMYIHTYMYITTSHSTFKAFFSEGGRLLAVFEFEFESTGVVDDNECEREDSAWAKKTNAQKKYSGKSMP